MTHSVPGWTFTLKLENGKPVCLVRDHIDYFTAYEHDKQQKQKAGQTLTYREFVKDFNALGQGHHASHSSYGGVVVVDLDGSLEAGLDPNYCSWSFRTSARGYLSYDELTLMAELAKTPPELRGGINDD